MYKLKIAKQIPKQHRRFVALAVVGLALLVVASFALYRGMQPSSSKQLLHQSDTVTYSHNNSSSTDSSNNTPTKNPTSSGIVQGSPPKTPSTDGLVSNHKASMSTTWGSESSVCGTSPQAYCEIRFTSGSVTKSLPKKQANTDGAAYWNSWTPSDIGLTSGNWTITAIATLNNQTRSATDPVALQISNE